MDQSFDLHITLGNDAMRSPADVARELRSIASQLEDQHADERWIDRDAKIIDPNGNTVGSFIVT